MAKKGPKLLVLGGIKSGKSRLALRLAEKFPPPRLFIATAEAFDKEMAAKIRAHQKERGQNWLTIEAPVDLPLTLKNLQGNVCLIDCLTVWLGNLWYYRKNLNFYIENFLEVFKKLEIPVVVVSNEIGLGPLPGEKESRKFAEKLGLLNQKVAFLCDEIYLVMAGYPLKLK